MFYMEFAYIKLANNIKDTSFSSYASHSDTVVAILSLKKFNHLYVFFYLLYQLIPYNTNIRIPILLIVGNRMKC